MTIPKPLVVDMADLTLGELAELGETMGTSMSDMMSGPQQAAAIAAIAWLVGRRFDAAFTLEDAKRLRMADLTIIGGDEASPKDGNGNAPLLSPASGP